MSTTNSINHGGSGKFPMSTMGEASGIAFLLGNHAKFGLAERSCYHFDLIETLTSLPLGRLQQSRSRRRDRGLSVSSQEGSVPAISASGGGGAGAVNNSKSSEGKAQKLNTTSSTTTAIPTTKNSCICGVVSLLECVAGGTQTERAARRVLRSKHREFNTRAQAAWGRGNGGSGSGNTSSSKQQRNDNNKSRSSSVGNVIQRRRCHQPRHLPLPLNPNTRVTFAYELTSIAIVVDASPSLTSTTFETKHNNMSSDYFDSLGGGEEKSSKSFAAATTFSEDGCCVPLDRLGSTLKTYLLGLVQPIDIPPVAVSGKGVAFGRWCPNLAVTVVAAYPPTSNGDEASAGLLVRDFRVTDEMSALELVRQIERWALREVESNIADRLCGGEVDFEYKDGLSRLGSFALPPIHQLTSSSSSKHARSSVNQLLSVGDAALRTLPPEGRPIILVASDCQNLECTSTFEFLTATDRADVPLSVIDLSLNSSGQDGLNAYDFSSSLPDTCQMSGGIFLHRELLESCVKAKAGFPARQKTDNQMTQHQLLEQSRFQGDVHFCSKKRSLRPNALQWYTLFILSPFTPGGHSLSTSNPTPSGLLSSSSLSLTNLTIAKQSSSKSSALSMEDSVDRPKDLSTLSQSNISQERIMISKYSIQPVRIKSLLMSRVLEGYRARRYGQTTQDSDKVSILFTLRISDCDVVLHYEVSFVSSPWHIPTVGTAHIKLELGGENKDFIQLVKKVFMSNRAVETGQQGKRIPAASTSAAEKICKLLRWIRKEDYLDSYLCLPGWGDVDHLSQGSSFLRRLLTLSKLQRHRHFRSETLEVVTTGGGIPYERAESIFGDIEQNIGEKELFETLSSWSTEIISDSEIYLKEITSAREDDLAYYCVARVSQYQVSRLFSITVDFHGELDAEQRLALLFNLEESLRSCSELIVLERGVSKYIALRPLSSSAVRRRSWDEYYLHHKSWMLLQDPEVLPLLFKRRHMIGSFFILHADENRAVFCKFVENSKSQTSDMVVYQVLQRQDGIYVDIHMESCRAVFHPFRSKDCVFYALYERVRRRDKDCARNLRSRTNLLAELDSSKDIAAVQNASGSNQHEVDVMRIMKVSTSTVTQLRFFGEGSGSANHILSNMISKHLTSDSFHTQTSRLAVEKVDHYEGIFFIMRLDWYVLSVACLEFRDHHSENEAETKQQSYRDLTFFTAGIIDLYQSDDETRVATSSAEDQFSEALPIDEILAAHPKLYAMASYEALRNSDSQVTSFRSDELSYALSALSFKEVLHASITLDDLTEQLPADSETSTGQRLAGLINTLLSPVPGSGDTIFYYHEGEGSDIDSSCEAEKHTAQPKNDELDLLEENYSYCEELSRADDQSIVSVESDKADNLSESGCPLYFQLIVTDIDDIGIGLKDEVPVSLKDIRSLKKSAILTAQVSVFEESSTMLPTTHTHVIRKLQQALNEFASEQMLDKYRYLGYDSLTTEDFKVIMRNLSQSKHFILEVPITFYVSRSTSMIKASDPTGVNESDLDHGYQTLLSELAASNVTSKSDMESFLVVNDDTPSSILQYWCFVQVKKASGSVIVRVHHPLGIEAAEERAEITKKLVINMVDRTNQRLLLESMYKTRKAPAELFDDKEVEESPQSLNDPSLSASSRGMYACPVQYRHEFPLHRRVSPPQAVRTLHSSILQNFMLSNRSGVSVYRDESNNIYYTNLIYRKNIGQDDDENSHVIELLVYGIAPPGPVITEELVRLLQRKLLQLPLDALSSVLNKNPQYTLLATDMSFINNFSRRLKEIEPEIDSNVDSYVRTYDLPSHVQDPLTLLLMFRQNICASTFIQRLHHESSEVDVQVSDMMKANVEDGNIMVNFPLPRNEFCFFFNSLGLGLDPAAQHVTTLTEQGRIYSRQAGSGIAIIHVSLMGSTPSGQIYVGKGKEMLKNTLGVTKDYISLTPSIDESKDVYKLVVNITNTTVDIEAIHKWVLLSLSQVLAAYTIERHRESCLQYCAGIDNTPRSAAKGDREVINQLMPGLPPLEDMMTMTIDLPHPAMMKVQSKKRLQATSLAALTLDLTEKAILSAIFNKTMRLPFNGIDIFRLANNASHVSIVRDRRLKAKVVSLGSGSIIKDNHATNPEYVCVVGLRQSDGNALNSPQHLFFKEIYVPRSDTSAFADMLTQIKTLKPALFERHLIFILRVNRNCRTLMAYNASPHIWAIMKSNFTEIEGELCKAEEVRREHYVGRCMDQFPFTTKKEAAVSSNETMTAAPPPRKEKEQPPTEEPPVINKGPVRRIKRPTSMLRPKLIGKSVDGAAAQAVQASRLRAKASLPQRGSVSKLTSPAPTQKKQMSDNKPVQQKQKQKQKQRRDSAQKEIGRAIVQSTIPSTTLKFYRDLTALLKEVSESHLEGILAQSILQQVTHAYFALIKEKQSPSIMLTRLISNCYGAPIGCGSICHLRCDNELSSIKSFLQFVSLRWGAKVIQSPYHQLVYLQKNLLLSERRRVCVMMEILMTWDGLAKCFIFHYKVWLTNSSDNSKKSLHLSRVHAEQEAATIDIVALSFLSNLALESQVLNFSGRRLAKAAKELDKALNTLALLRCTIVRFSEQVQLEYCLEGSADYMLQRRFLAPSFLGEKLLENYDRTKLFQHFRSDGKTYKLNVCSGAGEEVFVCGMLKIAGFFCYVFIAAHETIDAALEVFTLCLTRGARVDSYIAIEGSPFAERICDVVLRYSMTTVEEIITAVATNMRNAHLWRIFGNEVVSSPLVSEVLMNELRQSCQHIDLIYTEPRLQVLLSEADELQLSWDEVFQSFDLSPLFHCIRFDREEETNWVVYSREYDTFIDIVSESSKAGPKQCRSVQILLKSDKHGCAVERTVNNVSDQFVSFVLNWIWNDCRLCNGVG